MSIILTGYNSWAGDIQKLATEKVLQSPIARAVTFYKRDIGTSPAGFQYTRDDFGANGNQLATTMPVLSSGQNHLTGVHADKTAVTAQWALSGHEISFTAGERLQAESMGFSQYDSKKIALARVYQRYTTQVATIGVPSLGNFTGLINNASVAKAPVKSGKLWTATGTTAEEILDDIGEMYASVISATGGDIMPDTLMIGASNYGALLTKKLTGTSTPLLQYVKDNFGIREIVSLSDAFTTINGKQRMSMHLNDEALIRIGASDIGTYGMDAVNGIIFKQDYLFGFGQPEIYELASVVYRDFP